MNRELNCVDCGNVFFGGIHSSFGNGLGLCSICQASRKANERFEKEMAQRRKYERQSSRAHSDSSSYSSSYSSPSSSSSSTENTDGLVTVIAAFVFIILAVVVYIFVFSGNYSKKEYSFYTPNDGSLKQSLKPGVVYHQHKCGKHSGLTDDPSSCVEIPKNDFDRFCNEFDGINTVDNREILDRYTGEITSLSREVTHWKSHNTTTCHIKFSTVVDGKVKTGTAMVITWTLNADGKLVPYSSYRSTRWE